MNKKNQKTELSECLARLKVLRESIEKSDAESRIKSKLESEVIAKEISAIRLLQGYDRIVNNLTIAVISAIGGGGLIVAAINYLKK